MKKLVIFEDSEIEFTKELLKCNTFEIILIRILGYGRFSDVYVNFTQDLSTVFYVDIFVDLDITLNIFENIYSSFLTSEDIFFINLSEKGQYYAQKFANKMNFNGCVLSEKNIPIFKDKLLMKNFFNDISVKTVEYIPLYKMNQLSNFDDNYIVKLRNSDSCRGIYSVNKLKVVNKFDLSLGYLIEKKINFTHYNEYAVDIIVNDSKCIDYFVTKYPVALIKTLYNKNINGNITMRFVDEILRSKINETIQKILSNLSIKVGFLHLEFFYDPYNIDLVVSEFAYRLAGGRIVQNYEESYGISFSKIFEAIVLNDDKKLNNYLLYTDNKFVGDLYLPIDKIGKIKTFTNIEDLKIEGLRSTKYYYEIGQEVKVIEKNSHNAFGNVAIEGSTENELYKKMLYVRKNFFLEVE